MNNGEEKRGGLGPPLLRLDFCGEQEPLEVKLNCA
jgi:hypothetical protein